MKDKFDYNGTESYIYEKFERKDLSWFPIERAMCLKNNTQDDEEDINAAIGEKLSSFEKKIVTAIKTNANNRNNLVAGGSGHNSRQPSVYPSAAATKGK